MIVKYVKYHTVTGFIERIGLCDETLIDAKEAEDADFSILITEHATVDDENFYVDPQTLEITARPASPVVVDKTTITADGVDQAVFTNVPWLTVVYAWENFPPTAEIVLDGVVEVTSTVAATINVHFLELYPYKESIFTLTAV